MPAHEARRKTMTDTNEHAAAKPEREPKVALREAIHKDSRAAKPIDEVTDELGRVLKVRKINAVDRYDLAKLIGGANVSNLGMMAPAAMAFSVTAIDGDPVFRPAKESELRMIIQRLDQEGLDAVAKAYVDNGWVPAEVDKEALGN
jgi:hypothetical protein